MRSFDGQHEIRDAAETVTADRPACGAAAAERGEAGYLAQCVAIELDTPPDYAMDSEDVVLKCSMTIAHPPIDVHWVGGLEFEAGHPDGATIRIDGDATAGEGRSCNFSRTSGF